MKKKKTENQNKNLLYIYIYKRKPLFLSFFFLILDFTHVWLRKKVKGNFVFYVLILIKHLFKCVSFINSNLKKMILSFLKTKVMTI